MKHILTAIAALLLLAAAPATTLRAQSSSSTMEDGAKSLEISKGIISILRGITKNFEQYQGTLISKSESGTSIYNVSGLDQMQADEQYIAIRKDGVALYMATYKGSSDADVKKLASSFAAFTGGIITITKADGNFTVEQDKEKSADKVLVYSLKLKGTKVGTYSMDAEKKEGTMLIGLL